MAARRNAAQTRRVPGRFFELSKSGESLAHGLVSLLLGVAPPGRRRGAAAGDPVDHHSALCGSVLSVERGPGCGARAPC